MVRGTITKAFLRFVLMGGVVCAFDVPAWAQEVRYTLEGRDRLIRVETTLREFKEGVDKHFEQIDQRFEQMLSVMWILASVSGGLVGSRCGIGGRLWHRR